MKNLEKLISRTAECRRVFAGKRDLDYVAVTYSEALLIKAEVDARIAELTADLKVADRALLDLAAEVARYKAAMQSIVDDYKQAFHTDWTTAANYADIARNALKEGV